MITVKTASSLIVNNDGSPATGYVVITPSSSFEFLDTDGKRKKVGVHPVGIIFIAGLLNPNGFPLAPTVNAAQDNVNLYYTADFYTNVNGDKWTEYWVVDANGANPIEITAMTQVIVDPIALPADFISSDSVSTVPTANIVPRALATGFLDAGWFAGSPGGVLVGYYVGNPLPTPALGTLALGYDPVQQQVFVWDSVGNWRAIG
jgi:hypothetical protein